MTQRTNAKTLHSELRDLAYILFLETDPPLRPAFRDGGACVGAEIMLWLRPRRDVRGVRDLVASLAALRQPLPPLQSADFIAGVDAATEQVGIILGRWGMLS